MTVLGFVKHNPAPARERGHGLRSGPPNALRRSRVYGRFCSGSTTRKDRLQSASCRSLPSPELTDRLKGYNSHKRVCCRFCVAAVIVPEAQTRPVPQSSLRGRLDGDGYPFAVAFLRNLRNMRRKRIIPGPALSPQWLSLRFSIRPQMLVHPSIPVLEWRTRS